MLKNQLPPFFLKIGLLFWFFNHNLVIFKVTAIKLCMLQVYNNSLDMLSVVYVQSNVMWSKTVGKIRERL